MIVSLKKYKKQDKEIRIKILKVLNNTPGYTAEEVFLLQHLMNEGFFIESLKNQLRALTQDKSIDKIEKDGTIRDTERDEERKVTIVEYSISSQGLKQLFERSESRSNIWRRALGIVAQ